MSLSKLIKQIFKSKTEKEDELMSDKEASVFMDKILDIVVEPHSLSKENSLKIEKNKYNGAKTILSKNKPYFNKLNGIEKKVLINDLVEERKERSGFLNEERKKYFSLKTDYLLTKKLIQQEINKALEIKNYFDEKNIDLTEIKTVNDLKIVAMKKLGLNIASTRDNNIFEIRGDFSRKFGLEYAIREYKKEIQEYKNNLESSAISHEVIGRELSSKLISMYRRKELDYDEAKLLSQNALETPEDYKEIIMEAKEEIITKRKENKKDKIEHAKNNIENKKDAISDSLDELEKLKSSIHIKEAYTMWKHPSFESTRYLFEKVGFSGEDTLTRFGVHYERKQEFYDIINRTRNKINDLGLNAVFQGPIRNAYDVCAEKYAIYELSEDLPIADQISKLKEFKRIISVEYPDLKKSKIFDESFKSDHYEKRKENLVSKTEEDISLYKLQLEELRTIIG